jgi:hypothetical protein
VLDAFEHTINTVRDHKESFYFLSTAVKTARELLKNWTIPPFRAADRHQRFFRTAQTDKTWKVRVADDCRRSIDRPWRGCRPSGSDAVSRALAELKPSPSEAHAFALSRRSNFDLTCCSDRSSQIRELESRFAGCVATIGTADL